MGESAVGNGASGPTPELWIGWHAEGMRGMQEAARWVLGVVAAGLLTVVQLDGLGRFGPSERPWWVAAIAGLAVVTGMALMLHAVLALQPGAGGSRDVRRLGPEDFKVVQEWGMMLGYPDSHARFADIAKKREMLAYFSQTATTAELRRDRKKAEMAASNLRADLAHADWEEHRAVAIIGNMGVKRLFDQAKRRMLVCGLVALVGITVLTWATNPPPSADTAHGASGETAVTLPVAHPE